MYKYRLTPLWLLSTDSHTGTHLKMLLSWPQRQQFFKLCNNLFIEVMLPFCEHYDVVICFGEEMTAFNTLNFSFISKVWYKTSQVALSWCLCIMDRMWQCINLPSNVQVIIDGDLMDTFNTLDLDTMNDSYNQIIMYTMFWCITNSDSQQLHTQNTYSIRAKNNIHTI